MKGPTTARAPKGATGTCRDPRRAPRGRRAGWVRPFRRARVALDASLRLIESSHRAYMQSESSAVPRPIGTSRNLGGTSDLLMVASARLKRAAQELAAANECLSVQPEAAARAPELLIEATERWECLTRILGDVAEQVFTLHGLVLDGLVKGELVPEPAQHRRRIVLAPRPVSIRAFLCARQPRVADRISPVLLRRRRIRRPAAVSVPRRSSQGRAPPLFSICLF